MPQLDAIGIIVSDLADAVDLFAPNR